MTCSYLNPSPEAEAEAKAERRHAIYHAANEDDRLVAAESEWRDYLPPCWCSRCLGAWDDDEPELYPEPEKPAMRIDFIRHTTRPVRDAGAVYNNHPTAATNMAKRNREYLEDRAARRSRNRRILRACVRLLAVAAVLAVLYSTFH